jgi:hypothetical protein
MTHDSYDHYPDYDDYDDPDAIIIDDPDAQVKALRERESDDAIEDAARECAWRDRVGDYFGATLLEVGIDAPDLPTFNRAYAAAARR